MIGSNEKGNGDRKWHRGMWDDDDDDDESMVEIVEISDLQNNED